MGHTNGPSGGGNGRLTIEWAPFTLVEGVDEAALMAAADEIQAGFLAGQSGYIRRELLRAGDRQYVDIIYWRSREEAEAAAQRVWESAECQRYFQLMVPNEGDPSGGVLHLEQMKVFDG